MKAPKKIRLTIAAALLATMPLGAAPAQAASLDPMMIGMSVIGGFLSYHGTLKEMLAIGNNVDYQISGLKQDMETNGEEKDEKNRAVVDAVLTRLTQHGEYALHVNSLPFLWRVNANDTFNASCYPTDYISVNRGLVRALHHDEDELAAVLGHEMTHGLRQHSAKNYAKAVAESYAGMAIGSAADNLDWQKLNAVVAYAIAKDVTLPSELEADEGGFYLMTTAGFNPGGGAAAMARMAYYLTYETQDISEYQDPFEDPDAPNYNDHPAMADRIKRLAGYMTTYSMNHVTVENGKDVLIDGQLLLTADWDAEYNNTTENAYLIAGGIAKALHDKASFADWNFRADKHGRRFYLDDSRVYEKLKKFVSRSHAETKLEELVRAAYANPKDKAAREKVAAAEKKRSDAWQSIRSKALDAKSDYVKQLRYNADRYSDNGMAKEALFLMERAFAAKNPDNVAENYAIRGRARAVAGDYEAALADADHAVELDSANVYNFLNHADVRRMRGEREAALADLDRAQEIAADNPFTYKIRAEIFNEMGEKDKALAAYRDYWAKAPKARDIPDEYMKDVDAAAYEKMKKEREEAEKKKAEKAAKDKAAEETEKKTS
ncbi:M48 family metalloprotease [Selenomonas sputigena]|uniref:M48 family metalloprotease n=1 Tax=Selenomonas sputigena TaxID=69823 RepID=A0ABV3X442_9FIRM